jgi:hypothetical protein
MFGYSASKRLPPNAALQGQNHPAFGRHASITPGRIFDAGSNT